MWVGLLVRYVRVGGISSQFAHIHLGSEGQQNTVADCNDYLDRLTRPEAWHEIDASYFLDKLDN